MMREAKWGGAGCPLWANRDVETGVLPFAVAGFRHVWDETIGAMKQQPDDDNMDNLYLRQL